MASFSSFLRSFFSSARWALSITPALSAENFPPTAPQLRTGRGGCSALLCSLHLVDIVAERPLAAARPCAAASLLADLQEAAVLRGRGDLALLLLGHDVLEQQLVLLLQRLVPLAERRGGDGGVLRLRMNDSARL